MTVPHGLLGKAYFVSAFIAASIVVLVLAALIISAPLRVIAGICGAMLLAAMIFVVWLSRQPTGEG